MYNYIVGMVTSSNIHMCTWFICMRVCCIRVCCMRVHIILHTPYGTAPHIIILSSDCIMAVPQNRTKSAEPCRIAYRRLDCITHSYDKWEGPGTYCNMREPRIISTTSGFQRIPNSHYRFALVVSLGVRYARGFIMYFVFVVCLAFVCACR